MTYKYNINVASLLNSSSTTETLKSSSHHRRASTASWSYKVYIFTTLQTLQK